MVEQTTEGNEAMLILTRKRDDSIKIGEDIVIRVMRTARGSVKIGIEAPASIRIVRGELNEFGEIAGATASAGEHVGDAHDEAAHADAEHGDDHHEHDLHDEYMLHELHNLEVVMQH